MAKAIPFGQEIPYVGELDIKGIKITERDFVIKKIKEIREIFNINKAAFELFIDILKNKQRECLEEKDDEESQDVLRKYNLIDKNNEIPGYLKWRAALPALRELLFQREEYLNEEGEYWTIPSTRIDNLTLEHNMYNYIHI